MKWKERPSLRELELKLATARKCIAEGRHLFGPDVKKLVDEFAALNIGHTGEVWPLLTKLLEELTPKDYAGTHPPMKAIESGLGCELFIFVWESKTLKQLMYIKFAIKDSSFYYFSLHNSQKPEKFWKFIQNFQRKK